MNNSRSDRLHGLGCLSIPPRDDPEERDPGDPWQRHYEKAQAEGHEKLSAAELHGAALHAERIGDKAGVKKFAAARDKKQSRQDAAQTGKRGGRFYLTASGTKVYLTG